MPKLTDEQFEKLFPAALEWAQNQEEYILSKGFPLSPAQTKDALKAGVKHPEKVRVLEVQSIPFPKDERLQQAVVNIGLLPHISGAATFGRGICLRERFIDNRYLLVRELVLVARYEQLGGMEPFLREYIRQSMLDGINLIPMEKEAEFLAEHICSEDQP